MKNNSLSIFVGMMSLMSLFVFSPVIAATCAESKGTCGNTCTTANDLGKLDCAGTCCKTPTTCVEAGGSCANICSEANRLGPFDCKQSTCCKTTPDASDTGGSSISLTDPLHGVGIYGAINRLVTVFLGIVGAMALLVFVYAGVMYMTAGGSEERVTKARDVMKYAILGLAIIVFAYILTNYYFQVLTA